MILFNMSTIKSIKIPYRFFIDNKKIYRISVNKLLMEIFFKNNNCFIVSNKEVPPNIIPAKSKTNTNRDDIIIYLKIIIIHSSASTYK